MTEDFFTIPDNFFLALRYHRPMEISPTLAVDYIIATLTARAMFCLLHSTYNIKQATHTILALALTCHGLEVGLGLLL